MAHGDSEKSQEHKAEVDGPQKSGASRPRRRFGCLPLLFVFFFLSALIAAGALGAGWLWLDRWGETKQGRSVPVQFTIEPGTSTRQIATDLENRGLIDDQRVLLAWLKVNGKAGTIQAGEYTIEGPLSPRELVGSLRHGSFEQELTIPEGWTSRQIARRLVAQEWIESEQAWLDLVSSPTQVAGAAVNSAEGYCFPETYRFAKGTGAPEILDRMLDEFGRQWNAAHPDDRTSASLALTLPEVVTLASMIEREARLEEEMPRIASVYLNRLKRKIKLQCCATVYYSLGEAAWSRPLTYADLKVDSPYNTYAHPGLPPGPISNPGRAAIEAVLRPEKTDYLFYVYAGDNRHVFSKTAREHNAAVRAARKKNPQAEVVQQNGQ